MTKRKRTGKFYNKNEAEVMQLLGLTPTAASGAGWIEKEDGQDDNIICQLKSTDANSIKINLLDVEKLEYQAMVTNKLPVFAIQFLKHREDIDMGTFLLIKPSDLLSVVDYIRHPYKSISNNIPINIEDSEGSGNDIDKIVSSAKAKDKWKKEQEDKWANKKRW